MGWSVSLELFPCTTLSSSPGVYYTSSLPSLVSCHGKNVILNGPLNVRSLLFNLCSSAPGSTWCSRNAIKSIDINSFTLPVSLLFSVKHMTFPQLLRFFLPWSHVSFPEVIEIPCLCNKPFPLFSDCYSFKDADICHQVPGQVYYKQVCYNASVAMERNLSLLANNVTRHPPAQDFFEWVLICFRKEFNSCPFGTVYSQQSSNWAIDYKTETVPTPFIRLWI